MMGRFAWKTQPRRVRIVVVLAVLIAVMALGAWIASILLRPHFPTQAEVTARAKEQAGLSGGAQVYATHCAACHNHAIGPSLGGRGLDVAAITAMVRIGPGPMPAFPPAQVSDADISAVAKYLETLPSAPVAKDAK